MPICHPGATERTLREWNDNLCGRPYPHRQPGSIQAERGLEFLSQAYPALVSLETKRACLIDAGPRGRMWLSWYSSDAPDSLPDPQFLPGQGKTLLLGGWGTAFQILGYSLLSPCPYATPGLL